MSTSTSGQSSPPSSDSSASRERFRAGDGYLLLALANACGWASTVTASRAGVRVELRHPLYGECAYDGASVAHVAPIVVEWALLRARLGAELRRIAELAERCSTDVKGSGEQE